MVSLERMSEPTATGLVLSIRDRLKRCLKEAVDKYPERAGRLGHLAGSIAAVLDDLDVDRDEVNALMRRVNQCP